MKLHKTPIHSRNGRHKNWSFTLKEVSQGPAKMRVCLQLLRPSPKGFISHCPQSLSLMEDQGNNARTLCKSRARGEHALKMKPRKGHPQNNEEEEKMSSWCKIEKITKRLDHLSFSSLLLQKKKRKRKLGWERERVYGGLEDKVGEHENLPNEGRREKAVKAKKEGIDEEKVSQDIKIQWRCFACLVRDPERESISTKILDLSLN